jgi:hypothetical protein
LQARAERALLAVEIMMILLAICLLVGMALGQRCNVFALVPATGLALVAAIGADTDGIWSAGTDGIWSSALAAVAAGAVLQLGYLFETAIQSFAAAGPANA